MNSAYIASVINSTLRSTTPILLAALGCAMCSQVGVFNVALEAQMLIACFTSIAVDYYTSSVLLSVLAGVLSGAVVGAVVAVLQVKYKAADMVVGTALNLLVGAITTFLLYLLFGLRGKLVDNRLMSLTKINLPLIRDIPFIGRVLENLTIIDYLSYIIAVILFVYLYKTVAGFRTLSVGINKAAAESLGTKATRIQMEMVILSGALCGLGGVVLSMGQVTMFTENMTSRTRLYCHGGSLAGNVPPAAGHCSQPVFRTVPGHRSCHPERCEIAVDQYAALYCHHRGTGHFQQAKRYKAEGLILKA